MRAHINPSKFGQVQEVVTQSSHFGNRREVYNGVDATFNWRFGRGGLLQGGTNVGRTMTECVTVDAPQQFCKNVPPFFLPQVKLSGSYPLPFWDLGVSATFQSLPGIPIGFTTGGLAANSGQYSATNAEVRPSLGRDLARGATGVTTAIAGSRNPHHVTDNAAAGDLRLDDSDLAELEAIVPLGPAFAES